MASWINNVLISGVVSWASPETMDDGNDSGGYRRSCPGVFAVAVKGLGHPGLPELVPTPLCAL